jgi:hypothetical protein
MAFYFRIINFFMIGFFITDKLDSLSEIAIARITNFCKSDESKRSMRIPEIFVKIANIFKKSFFSDISFAITVRIRKFKRINIGFKIIYDSLVSFKI